VPALDLGDAEVLRLASESPHNGDRFRRLWSGDTSAYALAGNDGESEADAALCELLGYYGGPDPERIDRLFRRSGQDIYLEMPINIAQAALGDTLHAPTLEGEEEVRLEPGTQSGDTVRLRGKGVPSLRGSGRGDQIITYSVVVPRKLNEHQRRLLRELQETLDRPQPSEGERGFFDKVRDALGL
jgi:hypothetical protein